MKTQFLVLLIFSSSLAFAELKPMRDIANDPITSLFAKGINAYQKGDYGQAVQNFKELTELQPQNEIAYYNWGLAEAKQENWGWSAALFRRALYLSPSFVLASRALELVLDKLPHVNTHNKLQGLDSFRSQYLRAWNWHLIFFILTSSLLLSGVSLIKYWSKRKRALDEELPLPPFPYVGLASSLITLTFIFMASLKSLELFEVQATLITKSSALRTGPSHEDTPLFEIFEGQELRLFKKHESWAQVQVPGGLIGWLPQSDLFPTTESSL